MTTVLWRAQVASARADSLTRALGVPARDALTLIHLVDRAAEDHESVDRVTARLLRLGLGCGGRSPRSVVVAIAMSAALDQVSAGVRT